jgi:hypothetical protein
MDIPLPQDSAWSYVTWMREFVNPFVSPEVVERGNFRSLFGEPTAITQPKQPLEQDNF